LEENNPPVTTPMDVLMHAERLTSIRRYLH